MRKEIDYLKQENNELKLQGAKLQETVKQRKDIFKMMQGKHNDEDDDEERFQDDKNKDLGFGDRNPSYKKAM